ncbi:MAG: histidine kinase dimerization/phosphoacceptor domain -containing protein [Bacteroidota bacterium]
MKKIYYLFLVSICCHLPLKAQNADRLISLAKTTTDTLVADELYGLAKKYFSMNMDSALTLALLSAEVSERLNYINGRLNSYRGLSAMAPRFGNIELGLRYVDMGIQLIETHNLPLVQKLNFLINKGASHTYQNEMGAAIETSTEAYQLALELGLNKKAALILNNVGVLYRKISEYDKAIETYQKSISLRTELNDSLGIAHSLFNLGATYSKIDSSALAFDVLKRAKLIFKNLDQKQEVIDCDLAMGTAAYALEDFEKARDLLIPLERNENINFDAHSMYMLHLGLADMALMDQNTSEAKRLLEEVEAVATSELVQEKTHYFEIKSKYHEAIKDYKNALEYGKKYQDIYTIKFNSEKLKYREEMEAKFQNAKKDFEITQLEKQEILIRQKLAASRQRNIILGIGMLGLAVFVWSLYSLNAKIRRQNKEISKANKDKEILLKEIHHRVKNNLQVVSSLLSMQARQTKDDTTKSALNSSKARVQSMSILHQSLYGDTNLTSVYIDHYINEIIENIIDTYHSEKPISVTIDIEKIKMDVDELVPLGLIVNELITNAYKYAFVDRPSGMITVRFKKQGAYFLLQVKDDGIGLNGNQYPTKEDSLGQKLIKEFTHCLEGEITIQGDNGGTDIAILFPEEELISSNLVLQE